jgi:hypothetical protein
MDQKNAIHEIVRREIATVDLKCPNDQTKQIPALDGSEAPRFLVAAVYFPGPEQQKSRPFSL